MIHIVIGHIGGIIIAFLLKEKLSQGANINNPKVLIVVVAITIVSFFEYQLYKSFKNETIYWRGNIEHSESPGRFRVIQYSYSILAGYFLLSSIFQLFL